MARTKKETITGTFHGSPKGYGFVTPEGRAVKEADWFVPRGMTHGAWDGDTVTLVPTDPESRAGKIAAVTHRANALVVGTLRKEGRGWYLVPDSDKLTHTIALTGKAHGLTPGLKAAVTVVNYGTETTPPMGALKQIFGPGGSLEAAVEGVLCRYEVTDQFPAPVMEEAQTCPRSVSPREMKGRRDFRGEAVVTIDSASAKDLDDAVSLTRDSRGRRVLGVHIADVSHYVARGTALDAEAFHRGTSVYFVNRVAPMLPTQLSNGICSLNPQVERLTLSCIMTLDEHAEVLGAEICQSVIKTADRLNYAEVNRLLAGETPETGPLSAHALRGEELRCLVRELDVLARQRVEKRRLRGALELTSGECYFVLDETGKPVDIQRRTTGRGESLIEECMLLANETVAKYLCDRDLPGVFRVHEAPSADKTEGLRRMVAPLGYELKSGDGYGLQKLLDHYRGTPQEGAVNLMVLRSLMKARYDPKNLGHFGLGADYYCHFTSPIRRYPDLVVHRALTAALTGKPVKALAGFTPQASEQSSQREVAAQNAEREIDKLYMARFMADRLGETFSGAVTGVTRFGVFVGLENGVEGMVALESLPRDRYDFDEGAQTLQGAESGLVFTFGTPLEVVCAAADPSTGRIDFVLEGMNSGISVQNKHRLDTTKTKRGKPSCLKNSGRGSSQRGGKYAGKRTRKRR